MPLIKSPSKEAVGLNIKKEVDSGKPQKQALAIALETQRRAGGQKETSSNEGAIMAFNRLIAALSGKITPDEPKVKPRKIITENEGADDDSYMTRAREKLTQTDLSGPEAEGVRSMPSDKRGPAANLMLRSRKKIMRGI